MDDAPYLRRQAALCLNLSRSCSDAQVAENLHLMAAEFHAQALRAELKAKLDSDLSGDPFDDRRMRNGHHAVDRSVQREADRRQHDHTHFSRNRRHGVDVLSLSGAIAPTRSSAVRAH
jgi:hypothetical protein